MIIVSSQNQPPWAASLAVGDWINKDKHCILEWGAGASRKCGDVIVVSPI
jgi:hypothetical protein